MPVSWWLFGLLAAVTIWWICFVALAPLVAVLAGLAAALAVAWALWRYGGVEIRLSSAGLQAGRAVLPWRYVAAVGALGAEDTLLVLGVDADARAHLVFRAYCAGSVKVDVADETDPTPYWLISSRRPTELAARLEQWSVQD